MAFEPAQNQTLAPWTTLGLGGESRWSTCADSEEGVLEALRWAESKHIDWMVLGGGSNVVVSDNGYSGLTVHLQTRGLEVVESVDSITLTAQAGEPWDALAKMCTDKGWAGFECLGGIPGQVGATPIQNVGAYGQEVSESIVSVRVYDAAKDKVSDWSDEQCSFGYRDSFFKQAEPGRYVVLAVTFRLKKGGDPSVLYSELSRALEGETLPKGAAGLQKVRQTVLDLRRSKAMVIDPDDPDSRSAGSFFTNPIVDLAIADRLTQLHPAMPRFAVSDPDGTRRAKLAAAWLIEKSGFEKGTRRGSIGISTKHALALVHYGGGLTTDLLSFAQEIRLGVFQTFGVALEAEPRLVGCALPSMGQRK